VTRALLDAILADPASDAARAVYADALQQAGDPHGELIALQLEGVGIHEKILQLEQRMGFPQNVSVVWNRGFVDSLHLPPAGLRKLSVLLAHPALALLSSVRAFAGTAMFPRTLRALRGARLSSFEVSDVRTFEELDGVLRAGWPLRRLVIHGGWPRQTLTFDVLRPLLDGEVYPDLRRLGLHNNELALPALRALRNGCPLARRLEAFGMDRYDRAARFQADEAGLPFPVEERV
jgi:uncharacterized protein (TIGR02996 family)